MVQKFTLLTCAVALAIVFGACKSEPKTDDIIVEKVVEKPQAEPHRMPDANYSESVTWIGGAEYSCIINRQAIDSLGATEINGRKYRHNTISLTVTRADGSVFFSKTFTKSNFAPALPKQFIDKSVLLDMTLDKAEGNALQFVATIGSPDENDDEFFSVLLVLDSNGATRLEEFTPEDIVPHHEEEE